MTKKPIAKIPTQAEAEVPDVGKELPGERARDRHDLKEKLTHISNELGRLIAIASGKRVDTGAHGMMPTFFFDIGNTLLVRSGLTSNFEWAPGAFEAVTFLSSRGAKLGIISNTANVQRAELVSSFPDEFFENFDYNLVLLSSEVGVEKPSLPIFYRAMAEADQPAKNCFFVGENLAETTAAQAAGMTAIRIADFSKDFASIQLMFE